MVVSVVGELELVGLVEAELLEVAQLSPCLWLGMQMRCRSQHLQSNLPLTV